MAVAQAAPANSRVSWVPDLSRVDGTPMTVDEIGEYRVFYEVDGPVSEQSRFFSVLPTATGASHTIDLTPRADPYVVQFAVQTIDTDGLASVLSETGSKSFQVDSTAVPSPVTGVEVTMTCGDGCVIRAVDTASAAE